MDFVKLIVLLYEINASAYEGYNCTSHLVKSVYTYLPFQHQNNDMIVYLSSVEFHTHRCMVNKTLSIEQAIYWLIIMSVTLSCRKLCRNSEDIIISQGCKPQQIVNKLQHMYVWLKVNAIIMTDINFYSLSFNLYHQKEQ